MSHVVEMVVENNIENSILPYLFTFVNCVFFKTLETCSACDPGTQCKQV